MRPALLRPPVLRRPSVSALTGFPFHNSRRSTMTSCRCEGVVGLKVFSAILSLPGLDSGGHVDPRAFAKGHDRLLIVGAPADPAAKALHLSLDPDRIDRGHLDINSPSTAALTSRFVAFSGTRKTTWLCSEILVAFSVMTGDRMVSNICWRESFVSTRGMTRKRLI